MELKYKFIPKLPTFIDNHNSIYSTPPPQKKNRVETRLIYFEDLPKFLYFSSAIDETVDLVASEDKETISNGLIQQSYTRYKLPHHE